MSYTENVANRLNDLLTKNYDAEAGYKKAAEKVSNSQLKNFFNQRAQERYNFGHELKSEIRSFGQEPDKGTSFAGDAHRVWIDIKTALSTDKDEAVLEEAIRGERAALEEYNEVLQDTSLPPSTAGIISKERDSVHNALQNVKTMENWA